MDHSLWQKEKHTHTQKISLKRQQRNLGMGTWVLEGIDCAMNLRCLEALWLRLWTNGVTNGHWETPLMNPRWSNTMSSKIFIQSNSTLSFNEFPTLSSRLSLSFEAEVVCVQQLDTLTTKTVLSFPFLEGSF